MVAVRGRTILAGCGRPYVCLSNPPVVTGYRHDCLRGGILRGVGDRAGRVCGRRRVYYGDSSCGVSRAPETICGGVVTA